MDLIAYNGAQYLEESSALNTAVYIADYNDVLTWPALPSLTGATASGEYVDLGAEVFVMKEGKMFHEFMATLEKNSFNSNLVGARGAKSFENMLVIGKSGSDKDLFGFLRANRNRKLVVAFKFLGATQFSVIGYKDLPAEVEEASVDVPAEIAGEKMTTMTIRSIFYAPLFINTIPLTPAPAPVAKRYYILDGKYEVLGVIPGPIGCQLGVVDLSTMNERTAEQLIALGNPYLRKVVPAPEPITRKRSKPPKEK